MTTRHVARARAMTDDGSPPYRVRLRTGEHDLVADEPESGGGHDAGPTPFGLLLSGLVACTAITLRMYADRKGWNLGALDVDARYDVADDGTASIVRTIWLPAGLPAEQRDRLAEIAERTPVTRAVRGGVPVTTTIDRRS